MTEPRYMPVDVSTSHPVLRIEVTPDSFGKMFADMPADAQAEVLEAMHKHMIQNPMQWDYLQFEVEKPGRAAMRAQFRDLCQEPVPF